MTLKNNIMDTSKLSLVVSNSKHKTNKQTVCSPVELPNQDVNNAFKHYLPANKEWSSNLYSFNKNNLVLAPQVSQWTYKLSKSYLNASPKHNLMDDIYIIRNRSKKNYSKIFFKDCGLKTSEIKMNKHLSTFRKNFRTNSNLRRNIMKFFSVDKSNQATNSLELQNNNSNDLSIYNDSVSGKRYSVLKTFLSKPEIRYSSRNVNITLYIYNRKNMFILKKIKKNFDTVKAKFKNNFSIKRNYNTLFNNKLLRMQKRNKFMRNVYGKARAVLKNKFIREWKKKNRILRKLFNKNRKILSNRFFYKLSKKSSTTFFLYMWRYLKVKSLNSFCKNINLFNNVIAKNLNKNLFILNKNKWNNLNALIKDIKFDNITQQQKKNLRNIIKKYYWVSKMSEEFLLSNFNGLKNNNFIVKSLKNIIGQDKNLFVLLNKSKKVYGFKPFANLYYFKHNVLSYYFEHYKRNNNNLLALKNIFIKIFFKKIYFNIVNLKYWNLDSKIMADIITSKLVDRTKNVLKILKRSITSRPTFNLVPTILKLKENNHSVMFTWKNDFFFSKSTNRLKARNIGYKLQNNKISNHHIFFISNKYKNNLFLDNLQNKWKIGTKLQAKGRITKRKTAQRSLSKIKYMGTLKNVLSSYGGISTSLSRGIVKSNLNSINNNNHSANGSFGIKVSISSLQTLQRWNMNTN
jgi:hypothetical protein